MHIAKDTQESILHAFSYEELGILILALPEMADGWGTELRQAWENPIEWTTSLRAFRYRHTHLVREGDVRDQLINACGGGSFDLVKYICKKNDVTAEMFQGREVSPLCMAVSDNHLDVVKYLVAEFNLAADETAYEKYFYEEERSGGAFEDAVEGGYFEMFTYLCGLFKSTAQANAGQYLQIAGGKGYLDIIKYILATHEPDRQSMLYAFIVTCVNGHLAVAKYMQESHKFRSDESLHWDRIYERICYNGHTHILKFLCEDVPGATDQLERKIYEVFRQACTGNRPETMKFLHRRYNITTKQVRYSGDDILIHTICYESYDAVEYIFAEFDVSPSDLSAAAYQAYQQLKDKFTR